MKKGQKMPKKDLMMFLMLWLFAVMLTLTSCGNAIKYQTNSVPCESLTITRYDVIIPLSAEESVLLNNAVIDAVCNSKGK